MSGRDEYTIPADELRPKTSQDSSPWTFMGDAHPEYGQLVVINFTENWKRLRLCYFDNFESWAARNPQEREDDEIEVAELNEAYIGGWFTESDDPSDWWQRQYVSYWMPISDLPQQDSAP